MTLPANEDLDTHLLGTATSPGKVVFSGHDRWENWEVQKAKGQVGATSQLNARDVGTFTATYFLAGDDLDEEAEGQDDFARWDAFERLLKSLTSGPTPIALPIYHPDLARNGWTEVSCGGIGGRVHDGKGGCSHTVKYIEFRPPKPKPAAKAKPKPGAGSGPNGAGQKPDPNAAAKAELAALLAEAKKP